MPASVHMVVRNVVRKLDVSTGKFIKSPKNTQIQNVIQRQNRGQAEFRNQQADITGARQKAKSKAKTAIQTSKAWQ